jgi:hypothetical protein
MPKNSPFGQSAPAFGSKQAQRPNHLPLRTQLNSKEEKAKYNELVGLVDAPVKKVLNRMLKTGLLLNNDSNDRSTVLDNLHKIATNPRAQGLSNKRILYETIETIVNPFIITQQFGDIPGVYREKALEMQIGGTNLLKRKIADKTLAAQEIAVDHSGTCVAASVEFNLAAKQPAEFTRFAEGLSSSRLAVEKTIKLKNLADNTLDAVWLLNAFEIPYEAADFDKVKVKLAPDKNAILRAQIQTTHRDLNERSSIDALMQSTFMQVGSQQSYNSLFDKRGGKFNQQDKGLIEFEKTFVESVVEDKNKISVTYQTVDENGRLVGYEADFATIKRQITDTLNAGENVIIGYTQVGQNNVIEGGHEITIVGTKVGADGKMVFICNDTDDDAPHPIEYSEDYLLPKIHHAALPKEIAEKDVKMLENWVEGFRNYKSMKAGVNEIVSYLPVTTSAAGVNEIGLYPSAIARAA